MAVKQPRVSESTNHPFRRKSEGGIEKQRSESSIRRNSGSVSPVRRNSGSGMRNSMQKINELPEGGNKPQKSGLRSFMGCALCSSLLLLFFS